MVLVSYYSQHPAFVSNHEIWLQAANIFVLLFLLILLPYPPPTLPCMWKVCI